MTAKTGESSFFSRMKMKVSSGLNPGLNTGKGRSKLNKKLCYGFHLVEGKTHHPMEDFHVAEFKRVDNNELGLFAIYDGHLGHSVASYLQDNLFDNILNEPEFWMNPKKAIKKAYQQTDGKILEECSLGEGGSTAVTAILMNGKTLIVANVGDSRAVLCRNGVAHQLTVDHEPGTERQQIERKGGFVSLIPGDVPRVDGQLAVARAFGDRNLKAHLSSEPDVTENDIDSTAEFMVIASDGLWKVMENQEAVDLVKNIKDPQVAATRLTEEALLRKSKDDISCIIVQFGK